MKHEFSFGVIADCQAADADDFTGKIRGTNDEFTNCYRLSPYKLEEAVRTFNEFDLEYIIHLGDFVDRSLRDADRLHRIMGRATAPLLHVLGNHEFWNHDSLDTVLAAYNMESNYYSMRVNGSRLIMLDTCDLGVLEHPEGSPEWKRGRALLDLMQKNNAINAYHWNGGIGERQMEWLNSELFDAAKHDEKAVLFAHHPVFPPGTLNALNDNEIMQMIDNHDNVAAFINGHNHGGNYGVRNSVPYVTIEGMLSGKTNAYGIVDVYGDRLEIHGYGRVPNRVLQVQHQAR